MKRLLSLLFVASFAAFPLFAADEEVTVEDTQKEEVTLDEVQESQDVDGEVTIQEEEKEEEVVG